MRLTLQSRFFTKAIPPLEGFPLRSVFLSPSFPRHLTRRSNRQLLLYSSLFSPWGCIVLPIEVSYHSLGLPPLSLLPWTPLLEEHLFLCSPAMLLVVYTIL